MNIGFDGKRAANNRTGLGNYSRWLISSLGKYSPSGNYFVYTPKKKEFPELEQMLQFRNIYLRLKPSFSLASFWRSFSIKKSLKKDGIALFHGLSHEIPFSLNKEGIKTIVTVHDLAFLRFPHYFKWLDRTIYNLKCRYACKHADRIIAISEQTKRDIIAYYGIAESKITVIYQSCDEGFKQRYAADALESVREKYHLPQKYILNVGTIEDRKNLAVVVKALKHIAPEYTLVVVGKMRPYGEKIKEELKDSALEERIQFVHNVNFEDLPKVYQMASLFVYPSRFEGFGIPIIEALYSGVPVIGATGSCLEEAGGPNSFYINPDDDVALADIANRILSNTSMQEQMIQDGLAYSANFDNEILAQQLINCYVSVLNS